MRKECVNCKRLSFVSANLFRCAAFDMDKVEVDGVSCGFYENVSTTVWVRRKIALILMWLFFGSRK